MANKFSFEEEAQSRIITTYQEALEGIAVQTNVFIDKVTEIANRTKYLPVIRLGKRCIVFYNDDVRQNVTQLFQDWIDGEASLKAFIEKMEGGEDAVSTATVLQQNLESVIQNMFNVKDETELDAIDTANPVLTDQDFDELKDITIQYKDQVQQDKDTVIAAINNEIDDNSAYACILAPITATFAVVVSSFEEISQQFDNVKEEYIQKQGEFSQTADELKTQMESSAQTAAEDALTGLEVDFHL